MAQSNDFVIKSEPCEVHFAGFRTTTRDLQRSGWKLAAHEDFRRAEIMLAMELPGAKLRLMARSTGFDARSHYGQYMGQRDLPMFQVVHCATDFIERVPISFDHFMPIDAEPQMVEMKVRRMSDMNFFAAPMVRTEEIIVEPQTVAECLDLIRKMQTPDLTKIRERNRRREAGEAMNQEIFHAQILSLAA